MYNITFEKMLLCSGMLIMHLKKMHFIKA